MSKRTISDIGHDINCEVEKIKAVERATAYMIDSINDANAALGFERNTISVLENIKSDFLLQIDNLVDELTA